MAKILIEDFYSLPPMQENKYCTMEFDPELSLIFATWFGYVKDEELIHAFKRGIEIAIEYKAKFWLCDVQLMESGFDGIMAWAKSDWYPAMRKIGLQATSILDGGKSCIFTQMSSEEFIKIKDNTVGNNFFFKTEDEVREVFSKKKATLEV